MERAVFVPDIDRLPPPGERYDRLYLGNEFCPWRLPGERELGEARAAAARRGMAFSLVTPFLDEPGLARVLALVRALPEEPPTEVVANDLGLIEALRAGGWKGTLVAGRLLTRQRRGPGFQSFGNAPPEAAAALRASALDSPGFVELLCERYAVDRFELDDLVQGVAVPPLPAGVSLSLYRPWLLVTATRNCPWVFDGRTWGRESGCGRPCRGGSLRLIPHAEALAGDDARCGVLSLRTSTVLPGGPGGGGLPSAPPLRLDNAPVSASDCVGVARSFEPAPEGSASVATPARDQIAGRTRPRAPVAGEDKWQESAWSSQRVVRSDRTPTIGTEPGRLTTRPLILGGCAQFLEHRNEAAPPTGVDRLVWQPRVPA